MSVFTPKCRTKESDPSAFASSQHNDDGAFLADTCDYAYSLDIKLAKGIAKYLMGDSVLELGAGCGCYTSYWRDGGAIKSVNAIDGGLRFASRSRVQFVAVAFFEYLHTAFVLNPYCAHTCDLVMLTVRDLQGLHLDSSCCLPVCPVRVLGMKSHALK